MPYQDHSISSLWKREFNETIADLDDNLSPRRAAESLRFVIGTGLLALDDIQNEPEKFFLAHRMLAKHAHRIGSGFCARFALHYNLFAGSVMALGSPQQAKQFVLRNEIRPSLGCFALTEQRAGDQSSFMVDTVAELSQDEKSFVLHTPYDTAAKTWIAQGLVADEAIVIANMIVHNHSYGPQAFLVRLRDEKTGELLDRITMLDMGPRPEDGGLDLNNARITFDHLRIPLSCHLCRYLKIQNGTVRHPLAKKIRIMDIIGQRTYTGRLTAAQSALTYTRRKLERTSNRMEGRMCWTPLVTSNRQQSRTRKISPSGGGANLQVSKAFLSHAFVTLDNLDSLAAKIEAELCQCQLRAITPKDRLQQAIAVAKVEAVETCIEICASLHDQQNDPHKGEDFLLCCKYAEGDSHTLMQKMARDLARTGGEGSNWQVKAALDDLKQEMIYVQMGSGCKTMQAWERCGEQVYTVAEAHIESVLLSYGCLVNGQNKP
ncbi:Peroxisomal acyl-coenzyme A oxidase 1 [Seminavis robusta]|uniref:Peroxisomal acyl-coenzyme A oxidase 1 n=1 Tax=Seminavis robusta TaxID=568900 RepID=A0A9N8HIP4_9STRA|nr:Peroxisomal acyl-coenzyme A oxidase 1 [Seminavis robusta]|eukprot:Sro711_g191250.1 Peroxisomal acyl-coenzyme A oxidase 1 (490) ;mRNA; f:41356-42825